MRRSSFTSSACMAHSSQRLCLLGFLGLMLSLLVAGKIEINIDQDDMDGAVPVPSGFMGLSLEPIKQIQYMADDKVFQALLRNLVAYKTGPLNIRWGGHTQDDDPAPLEQIAWEAMDNLFENVGRKISFTIPLNMRTGNVSTALQRIKNAKEGLTGDSIYSISLGNEPDGFHGHHPDQTEADYFLHRYWDDVEKYIEAIAPELDGWVPNQIFSGPSIADRKQFQTDRVARWAELGKNVPGWPFTKVLSWHFYVASAKQGREITRPTIENLMSQKKASDVRLWVQQYIKKTSQVGLVFRMDETNTLSYSGKMGVSNTAAAALWVIDHSLNIMQAGASGLNLHGAGCSPYSPVLFPGACVDSTIQSSGPVEQDKFHLMCPMTCGTEDAPAMVNSPYYGMLFMQKVLRNHANVTLMSADVTEQEDDPDTYKVYVLRTAKQLRVVVINKREEDLNVTISTAADEKGNKWGFGTVTRLLSNGKLDSTVGDMSLAGQRIDPTTGAVVGLHATCKIPRLVSGLYSSYPLRLPAVSATVVVIPTKAGRRADADALEQHGLKEEELCK